jgi:hypothetical protein
MKKIIRAGAIALPLVFGFTQSVRAGDAAAGTAAVDKAITTMGGSEKLSAIKAASAKVHGKLTVNGEDNAFSMATTVQGFDHARQEFEGDFGDSHIKAVTVVAGDKGWRMVGDMVTPLEEELIAGFKRNMYLQWTAINPTLLKDKQFKIDSTSDEQVAGKAAVAVKVIGPDAKEFTISFDKESGLPVKLVGRVLNYQGTEVSQETTYADYKDSDGIKKATHIIVSQDGQKLLDEQLDVFKPLEKVDDATFAEPK